MESGDYATPAFVGRKRPWASYVPGILALKSGRLGYSDQRGRIRFDEDAHTLVLGELADRSARFDFTTPSGATWVCRFWDRSAYPARPILRGPIAVAVTGYDTTERWAAADIAGEWYERLLDLAD